MGTMIPPVTVQVAHLMATMDRAQLVELAAVAVALTSLRRCERSADEARALAVHGIGALMAQDAA